jgi:hypothetical protein
MSRASFGWLSILCFVMGVSPLLAADAPKPAQADNTPPEGFTALFNGKDLTGWKGLMKRPLDNPVERAKATAEQLAEAQKEADENMRAHWSVKDRVLVFNPGPQKTGRSLVAAKDYADFELMVDWKILKGGDSGIYLRSSPQVQIWDTEYPDYFKQGADKGSGALWNNSKHERFPLVKADKPVGEWNTFWIKMVGDKVWVKLNGALVVDGVVMENYWEREKNPDKPIFPTGQIELQNHGNTLYFKNIYIKELPAQK